MPRASKVDLGLSVLCAIAQEGETLTGTEIADICGCSKSLITNISRNALKKLSRNKILKQHFDEIT